MIATWLAPQAFADSSLCEALIGNLPRNLPGYEFLFQNYEQRLGLPSMLIVNPNRGTIRLAKTVQQMPDTSDVFSKKSNEQELFHAEQVRLRETQPLNTWPDQTIYDGHETFRLEECAAHLHDMIQQLGATDHTLAAAELLSAVRYCKAATKQYAMMLSPYCTPKVIYDSESDGYVMQFGFKFIRVPARALPPKPSVKDVTDEVIRGWNWIHPYFMILNSY